MQRQHHGFTLIELLITFSILSLLLAVAAPSMAGLRSRAAVTSTHNLLMTGFAAARAHAVTQQHLTTICPGDPAAGCRSDGEWGGGWIVFVDANDNGRLDGTDWLVHSEAALPEGLRVTSGVGRSRATFRFDGSAGGSNLTLRICSEGVVRSAVILSNSGRARRAGSGEVAAMPGCG